MITLAACALGLLIISPIAEPEPGFSRAIVRFLRSAPNFLDGAWQFVADGLAAFAIAVVVLAAVSRRGSVVRDLVLAGVVAAALSLVVVRAVHGEWLGFGDIVHSASPPARYPSPLLAVAAAVVLAASPHLALPVRRLGRWLVVLAALAVTVLGATTPLGAIAGLLIAAGSASAVHLVFGSSAGRPSLDLVRSALVELGVPVAFVGVADRQRAGQFLVRAIDKDGQPLVVKVYGRDAHDTAVMSTLWRTVWYREAGSPLRIGRLQQVEHEAFLTLLAAQAGVLTERVVVAGATSDDDALLVLREAGRRVAPRGTEEAGDERLVIEMWAAVTALHRAAIAHGQVDAEHLLLDDVRIGFLDFRGAVAAPTIAQRRLDEAQAFVTSIDLVGEERATALAIDALGMERFTEVLPLIQPSAMTTNQQRRLRDAGIDLDDVRDRAAGLAGVEAPPLQPLRRFSVGSLLRVLLPGFAVVMLIIGLSGVDFSVLRANVRDASLALLVLAFLVTQLPRITQAISTLGAAPVQLPLGQVYALQLAISYINVAIPSTAARIAVNIRFFQRHGVPPGAALAAGGLDGLGGLVSQVLLLAGLLIFGSASLDLDLGAAAGSAARLVPIVLVIVVLAVAPVVIVGRLRRFVLGWAQRLGADALDAAKGLRSPRRLGLLLGGNVASEVLFAAALGAFCLALGAPVGLGELLLVNISVGLLSGLIPVPGGIGVAEGGLTYGLVLAGVPEEKALAAVLLYRLASFYLPPVWGYFAMRWLERRGHL